MLKKINEKLKEIHNQYKLGKRIDESPHILVMIDENDNFDMYMNKVDQNDLDFAFDNLSKIEEMTAEEQTLEIWKDMINE